MRRHVEFVRVCVSLRELLRVQQRGLVVDLQLLRHVEFVGVHSSLRTILRVVDRKAVYYVSHHSYMWSLLEFN
jgi:hypothetical protein